MNLRATVKKITEKISTKVVQALKDPKWCHVMYEEVDAYIKKSILRTLSLQTNTSFCSVVTGYL